MQRLLYLLLFLATTVASQEAVAVQFLDKSTNDETCKAAEVTDAQAVLQRAMEVTGLDTVSDQVLHLQAMDGVEMNFQSERTYPPFFSLMRTTETWFDPQTGIQRTEATAVFPGSGPNPYPPIVNKAASAFMTRDTMMVPVPAGVGTPHQLNALGVLKDWETDPEVRVAERCTYRDYWRTVLARPGKETDERLYFDPKTGFPVKLDTQERHYLWGQVHVEYQYSLWGKVGEMHVPRASFRVVDGATEITQTIGSMELISHDEAPALRVPDPLPPVPDQLPMFLQAIPPDTVGVGPDTYLLVNRGYTEAVALIDDAVYVFEATQNEERARLDHEWVQKLFPGDHPIVVVVTDLAWPHIAGVRYWVAQSATIVSHRNSEDFLRQVVERRWTMDPDLLEERRDKVTFRFKGIDALHELADGRVQLFPIDGIGSEGAIVAYLPEADFLWASDFIQRADEPTAYATEVWQAVQRVGVAPKQTAAQHLPLTPWETIESLQAEDE